MKPIRWTAHALKELAKREIAQAEAEKTIAAPDSVRPARPPRECFMRRYFDSTLQTEMLLRVFVEETGGERVIVTLYKTSKFRKYAEGL